MWCLGGVCEFDCPIDPQICQILFLAGFRKYLQKPRFAAALAGSPACMQTLAAEAARSDAVAAALVVATQEGKGKINSVGGLLTAIDVGERSGNSQSVKALKKIVKTHVGL